MITVGDLLKEGAERLCHSSESPRLDAEVLLAHVLSWSRLQLVVREKELVDSSVSDMYWVLIERRAKREPIAYITGLKEFWGVDFEVTPAVLIPRPDTETLVETTVTIIRTIAASHPRTVRCIDFGAGSGCISVAVALECKKFGIPLLMIAVERSLAAAQVCTRNIARHKVGDAVSVLCASWDSSIRAEPIFDVIVSNPPYIAPDDKRLSPETAFEPPTALFAPDGGLEDIRYLISRGAQLLRPGGKLVLEVGAGQAQVLRNDYYGDVVSPQIINDLAGIERVVVVDYSR